MFSSVSRSVARAALATTPVAFALHTNSATQCETPPTTPARFLRKKATLRHANGEHLPRRFNTKQEISKIRQQEDTMLQRWERDEDGWRELPARAWPAFQATPEQLKGIEVDIINGKCNSSKNCDSDLCSELLFQQATTLVFYGIDPEAGLEQFERLAQNGHVASMVACGVVLVEGMGVPPNEEKAIEWFQKAASLDSAQGCYELATVLYTGIDGIMDEDPKAAFELFRRAAEKDHVGALYMMADCLVEGEGAEVNVGQAVPLFYKAAEHGHRYSRQKIRELLAKSEYQ